MKSANVKGPIRIWAAPDENNEVVLMWKEEGGNIRTARSILTITLERSQAAQGTGRRLVLEETLKKPLLEGLGGPIFIAINEDEC